MEARLQGLEERSHGLCWVQVGLYTWCQWEDCREKGKMYPVRLYLTQLYLAHSGTAVLTFHIYPCFTWFGFRRKMLLGQFSRNQGGCVTPGLHQVVFTALLNCNVHTIKFTHCKVTKISGKLILCNHHHSPVLEHLHHPRKFPQHLVLLIVYEVC